LPQLDGVRAVAILLVMGCHIWYFFVGMSPVSPLEIHLSNFFIRGSLGVRIFFVLSGFLIYSSVLSGLSLPRYFAHRARRIVPGLVFFLALYSGLVFLNGLHAGAAPLSLANVLANITFLAPVVHAIRPDLAASLDLIPGTWSLNPEIWFYAAMPVAAWAGAGRRWPLLLPFLVLPPLWRAHLPQSADFITRFSPLTMADLFVWGMLAARARPFVSRFPVWSGAAYAGIALNLMILFASNRIAFYHVDLEFLAGLGGALLILGVSTGETAIARWLSARILSHIGRISFSLFLCHVTIIWYVTLPLVDWLGIGGSFPRFAVGGAATVLMSWLLAEQTYRYVELPWLTRSGRPWQSWKPAALTLVAILGLAKATAVLPEMTGGEGVDLLDKERPLTYAQSTGVDGILGIDGFPNRASIAGLPNQPNTAWVAIAMPLQSALLNRAVGRVVTLSAHVAAHGTGYTVCLGSYDGTADNCSKSLTPGDEGELKLRTTILNAARFQAKFNIFPTVAQPVVEVIVSDVVAVVAP
jgi:peptidoglycan/LPS O-acetylase OafA/YrhL